MISDTNPNGRPNSDVIRAYINGANLYKGQEPSWLIYFPADWSMERASGYQAPFEFVKTHVFPAYGETRKKWWILERPRPTLIPNLERIPRYIATVRHSKHRIFVWQDSTVLPDSALGAFATAEDLWFGILHSRPHELWSLAQGTQVRERESGFRYTPTSCLDTYPFPARKSKNATAIETAAKALHEQRQRWLCPEEWTNERIVEFRGSVDGPWARYLKAPDQNGVGTVQLCRRYAKDEVAAKRLAKRTLTELYNERPTWLDLAHRKLDEAVFAAYEWDPGISDEELLQKLLDLNLSRAAKEKN